MLFFVISFCWRNLFFLLGSPKSAVLLGIRRSELDHNTQCLNLQSWQLCTPWHITKDVALHAAKEQHPWTKLLSVSSTGPAAGHLGH